MCITSITGSCQMGLFMVVTSIVTRWSYFELWISVGKYLLAII